MALKTITADEIMSYIEETKKSIEGVLSLQEPELSEHFEKYKELKRFIGEQEPSSVLEYRAMNITNLYKQWKALERAYEDALQGNFRTIDTENCY